MTWKSILLDRMAEASTWRGLIQLGLGLTGYSLSDSAVTEIVTICLSITGLISASLPDRLERIEDE